MLKVIVIVLVLFWVARAIGRWFPRIEITFDRGAGRRGSTPSCASTSPRTTSGTSTGSSAKARSGVYLDCVEILGARREIERL
jgi:hypothetical protein